MFGLVAAIGLAVAVGRARARPRRPDRPDGRPGRRVHLRRADAQLPDPARRLRPPARRRARRDTGRPVGRRRSASRPCWSCRPAVRRRRAHRARPQHHQHGADRHRRRLLLVAVALRGLARRSRAGLVVTAFVAALVSTVVASQGFVLEYSIGGAAGASLGTVFALMAGAARADRHRRGHDHRGHRRRRGRGPARPGLPAARRRSRRRRRRRRPRAGRAAEHGPPLARFLAGFLLVAPCCSPAGCRNFASSAPGRAGQRHPARLHGPDAEGEHRRRHLHRPERPGQHHCGQPAGRLRASAAASRHHRPRGRRSACWSAGDRRRAVLVLRRRAPARAGT